MLLEVFLNCLSVVVASSDGSRRGNTGSSSRTLWFPPKRQWWLDIDANVSSLATV